MQKKCGNSTRFNRYLPFHKNRIKVRYYVTTCGGHVSATNRLHIKHKFLCEELHKIFYKHRAQKRELLNLIIEARLHTHKFIYIITNFGLKNSIRVVSS